MIRAVICDDELATQRIISYYIKAEGLPIKIVGTAADGDSALSLIKKEKPDLAFLDIQMPIKNGFEVIRNLTETHTKILIITGYGTFDNAQSALRLGASDIISKPIDLEQLREAITRSVGWNFTPSDLLNRALLYIHQNYTKKIVLEDLATAACCTPSHIAHLFNQDVSTSALTDITTVRINKAVQLLKDGESIQEVAYAVGYSSLNNFYKYFKEQTGKTPAAFRQDVSGKK